MLSHKNEIFIVKKGIEDYGYGLLLPLEYNEYNVIWLNEGVSISQNSKENITIFIPKENFMGGR